MVPPQFLDFFIASTGAGAALAGLLFVAVSLAPEQIVTRRAPMERRAVAGSAFTALINAFFISLVALIPHINFGTLIVPFSSVSLLTSLLQACLCVAGHLCPWPQLCLGIARRSALWLRRLAQSLTGCA